jgi:hypothetical protein
MHFHGGYVVGIKYVENRILEGNNNYTNYVKQSIKN